AEHKTSYQIVERAFPAESPYGWNNYPYDYWNIWVRHAGDTPYQGEPTLEMLTKDYDVIVFKHCFPVSTVEPDTGAPSVSSDEKRVENYRLQYDALRTKLRSFPKTKFIVWTGAALVESESDEAAAKRANAFFDWVRREWDQTGDNIFVWDFRTLETGGGHFLKKEYASGDSHPNEAFSRKVAPMFCSRIVDVITGRGDTSPLVGREEKAASRESARSTSDKPAVNRRKETPTTAPAERRAPAIATWVVDDAERPERRDARWRGAVRYVKEGDGTALRLDFSKAVEEDWGEYGKQRVIQSKRPAKNEDVRAFDQLRFRVRSDRRMELVVMLMTWPDSLPRDEPSHFGFSAYVDVEPGEWRVITLDLAALELGMEGDKAYRKAGEPTRIQDLSGIRFVTSQRNEGAAIVVDDIVFVRSGSKPST
ncbi:MAG: hypothetical protein KDA33_04965, partial [Phycisphaerales bacterium]|nr:hypothetical protein [Phycisphaerales bacterium]